MKNVIESARLRLSPYRMEDVPEVFDCIKPGVARFMPWDPPGSVAEVRDRHAARLLAGADTDRQFVIRLRSSGRCLGVAAVHDLAADVPELGLWLREDAHGQGYGTEVVRATAGWAFERFGKRRFTYPVEVGNTASRRIAERVGGVVGSRTSDAGRDVIVYEIPWGGSPSTCQATLPSCTFPSMNDHAVTTSAPSLDGLVELEEGMWRPVTRNDDEWMQRRLHPEFQEFGRSGRTYLRADMFGRPERWECRLPLPNLVVAELVPGVVQLTYDSIVRYGNDLEHGHRSSIWLHDGNAWRMRFHQGTPFVPDTESD